MSARKPTGTGRGLRRVPPPRQSKRLFSLEIVHEAGDWTIRGASDQVIRGAVTALSQHRDVDSRGGLVALLLTDDAHIRAINAQWRGKDQATNVLSFPSAPQPRARLSAPFLGDVVLATETLHREAKADGIPLEHHLQHLVIHGILHLLGYDHETDADAEVMERIEIETLAAIGVENPYDDANGTCTPARAARESAE